MRQVRQIMGMPITIDIPECQNDEPFALAFERFKEIDKKFSTYKQDSEITRFNKGELEEKDFTEEVKKVLKECLHYKTITNGYFSVYATGKLDPSGYVKGWAISEAGRQIEHAGFKTYCISAGGDILAWSNSKKIWHIGIQDPSDKAKILNKLSITNGAICTSGNYERGEHIINPKTGQQANELLSITVIGPDIIKADVLATAAFAMGNAGPEFIKSIKGYRAIAVSK